MPTTIYPLDNRIIVKMDEPLTTTKSGLLLPEGAADRPQQGQVVAVGPGSYDSSGRLIPMNVNIGEVVLVGKYTGTEVRMNGEKLTIMRVTDVMAVITEESVTEESPSAEHDLK